MLVLMEVESPREAGRRGSALLQHRRRGRLRHGPEAGGPRVHLRGGAPGDAADGHGDAPAAARAAPRARRSDPRQRQGLLSRDAEASTPSRGSRTIFPTWSPSSISCARRASRSGNVAPTTARTLPAAAIARDLAHDRRDAGALRVVRVHEQECRVAGDGRADGQLTSGDGPCPVQTMRPPLAISFEVGRKVDADDELVDEVGAAPPVSSYAATTSWVL